MDDASVSAQQVRDAPFVRFGRPAPPRKALYSIPAADGCRLSG